MSPASVAALLAAFAMVLNHVVTMGQVHRSMAGQTLILVAGMIQLSAAITKTGTTKMLRQRISNTATVLIIIPITLTVAAEAGLPP
ncbi:hypothetical protein [Arthrobacter sp.]|uniref:hypothetical protein n=1 Tax=Arthrobacter sp. TaxID=1667 RepID=UPI0026E080E2|nr:hypothetical protein [Arthrobacter sp.]MDO5751830.1 hypothetical protein [Arthrobacter sp.]